MLTVSPEVQSLPVITDPRELFTRYRESTEYQMAFNNFFTGKKLADDVTEDEKCEAFEGSEAARQPFFDFTKHHLKFHYDSSQFRSETQKSIQDYIQLTKDFQKLFREKNPTRDEAINIDRQRATCHMVAGNAIVSEGIAPNARLGRDLMTLILIDKGLEQYGGVVESSADRQRRVAA